MRNNPNLKELLPAQDLNRLLKLSTKAEYIKKDQIIKQGLMATDVILIQSGLAKVTREIRRDKNIILRIAQPGSFLGISSVISSNQYNYSVIALEPTSVMFIGVDIFQQFLNEKIDFTNEFLRQVSADNLFNINRLCGLLSKQLPGRVADLMLYFSEDIYNSFSFTLPLTRKELAELAGTTKESLIRTLSEFKHDKIIDMNRNHFAINSINILQTLSRLG
ncbi:MAG: Crp/Fnr family transcriptional regulator [Bacteroidales bacterium]|nr:Crp/Fnr family transcriptional regulator [Bacteroidales bacterium]MDD4672328.1 Crp/Fnr family transcriptional regulator [Bacteroidales bacterium]MDY0349179.1 Crp/Fnr family transcriptional regulator [Tenuifilaceae bacterium]